LAGVEPRDIAAAVYHPALAENAVSESLTIQVDRNAKKISVLVGLIFHSARWTRQTGIWNFSTQKTDL
jgi:hypothetical protein